MGHALGKLEVANQLELVNCCFCGTPFGVESGLHENLRNQHRIFYCPMGHQQSYPQKTEAERLREEAVRLRQQIAAKESALATERQLRLASDAKVNKFKRRVGNGVCPCCKRTFSRLARHMACKHPEFKNPDATKIA